MGEAVIDALARPARCLLGAFREMAQGFHRAVRDPVAVVMVANLAVSLVILVRLGTEAAS